MKTNRSRALVASLVLLLWGCNGAVPPTAEEPAAPAKAPAPALEKAPAPEKAPPPPAAPAATTGSSGPLRAGVALDAIAPRDLERLLLDVNPFRAEARFAFATGDKKIHLSVRVHESVERAREHVTAAGAAVVRKPAPATEVGLAWPGLACVERGLLGWAAVAIDNVTGIVRLEGSLDAAADGAMRAALVAFVEAVGEPLPAGAALPRPSVALAAAAPPRAEAPNALILETEKGCDFVAFEASNGASVLRAKAGPVLYAGEAGAVTVRVAVANRRLLSTTKELAVEVLPPE
ncbi:MAG: hypothetical protein ACAI25_20305 [Planctomycetota bacterium]